MDDNLMRDKAEKDLVCRMRDIINAFLRANPLFSQVRLHDEVKACEIRERLLREVVGARQRPKAWYEILNRVG
jgi:hypothetical protein